MRSKINNLNLGLILGIGAPTIALLVAYLLKFSDYALGDLIDLMISKNVLTKILSLSIIPNLALFFFFLNKNYYYSARGILLATIVFASFVFIAWFAL